jgi:hypothetical protein
MSKKDDIPLDWRRITQPSGGRHDRRAIYFGVRLKRQIGALFIEADREYAARPAPAARAQPGKLSATLAQTKRSLLGSSPTEPSVGE